MATGVNEVDSRAKKIATVLLYQIEVVIPRTLRYKTLTTLNLLLRVFRISCSLKKNDKVSAVQAHIRSSLMRGDHVKHDTMIAKIREIYNVYGGFEMPVTFMSLRKNLEKLVYQPYDNPFTAVSLSVYDLQNLIRVIKPKLQNSLEDGAQSSLSLGSQLFGGPAEVEEISDISVMKKIIDYKDRKFPISPLFEINRVILEKKFCKRTRMYDKITSSFNFPLGLLVGEDSVIDKGLGPSTTWKLKPQYRIMLFLGENPSINSPATEEITIAYPPGFSILVNKKNVNLSMVKVKPRISAPFDISNLIEFDKENEVIFEYISANQSFIFEIMLLRVLPMESSITSLKYKSFVSGTSTLNKLWMRDEMLGITTDLMTLNLDCPISGTRIQNPGKSRNCSHIQVFDITNFLTLNLSFPKWCCPVCNAACKFEDLIFDGLSFGILGDPLSSLENNVLVRRDGTWISALSNNGQETGNNPVNGDGKEYEIIDLTNDDDFEIDKTNWVYYPVKSEPTDDRIEEDCIKEDTLYITATNNDNDNNESSTTTSIRQGYQGTNTPVPEDSVIQKTSISLTNQNYDDDEDDAVIVNREDVEMDDATTPLAAPPPVEFIARIEAPGDSSSSAIFID